MVLSITDYDKILIRRVKDNVFDARMDSEALVVHFDNNYRLETINSTDGARMRFDIPVFLLIIGMFLLCFPGCGEDPPGRPDDEDNSEFTDGWNIVRDGIPQFISHDYIELDKIGRISRFRSGVGHSYHDNFERCRSMKHYFVPDESGGVDWGEVKIFSPVDGVIRVLREEWAGTQLEIEPDGYPDFSIIIFHVDLGTVYQVGDSVRAGGRLGFHVGEQTYSDIAVGVATIDTGTVDDRAAGWKLISYFEVVTDSLFGIYESRGVSPRDALIITRAERDSDPLQCTKDTFLNEGDIENWVWLTRP